MIVQYSGLYWPPIAQYLARGSQDDQQDYEMFRARCLFDDAWQRFLVSVQMYCDMVLPYVGTQHFDHRDTIYGNICMVSARLVHDRYQKIVQIEKR